MKFKCAQKGNQVKHATVNTIPLVLDKHAHHNMTTNNLHQMRIACSPDKLVQAFCAIWHQILCKMFT